MTERIEFIERWTELTKQYLLGTKSGVGSGCSVDHAEVTDVRLLDNGILEVDALVVVPPPATQIRIETLAARNLLSRHSLLQEQIARWCNQNGYDSLQLVDDGSDEDDPPIEGLKAVYCNGKRWWAIAPGGFIPSPLWVPSELLETQ